MDVNYSWQQVNAFKESLDKLTIGLERLKAHLKKIYTSETKCLKPEKSFWSEGGTEPLDFIYIFKNHGDPKLGVPKHWHYIGLGLTDIHGYSIMRRFEQFMEQIQTYEKMTQTLPEVYPELQNGDKMNGFGFELTARVACNSDEEWDADYPPLWPKRIMQDLARYVYQSRNIFSVGDHVAWHSPLDNEGDDDSASRIEHILMTQDSQLGELDTELGSVKFIQIVGVCREELEAAREWNVRGILGMMREREETGGPLLITNMRRGETIFELDSSYHDRLGDEIKRMGSDMAQISARHKTSPRKPDWFARAESSNYIESQLEYREDVQIYENSLNNVEFNKQDEEPYPVRTPSRMSTGSESGLKIENAEICNVRYYDRIYILLGRESARVLPVMLNGRLSHKRHFSFQSFKGDSLITFLPEGCPAKSLVSPEHPFAKHTNWLQIYVPDELRDQMYEAFKDFESRSFESLVLPKNYSWLDFNLHMTVVDEICDD